MPQTNHFEAKVFAQRIEILLNIILFDAKPLMLYEAMRYSCLGGKHLRALLSYSIYQDLINHSKLKPFDAIDGIKNKKYTSKANQFSLHPCDAIALAVELIHSYSLVHDDLPAMDDDDLRRGKPSTHKKFGEATAILVGDGLQAFAFEVLSYAHLNHNNLSLIIHKLAKASGSAGMVGGQMLDISPSELKSKKAIKQMYLLKTAKMIEASVVLPYFLVEQPNKDDLRKLEKIGLSLGLLFQIQDDLLEKAGAKMGKPSDSDIRNQKSTLLLAIGEAKTKKMQENLIKKIEKKITQLSFDVKNLKHLIHQIIQRDY